MKSQVGLYDNNTLTKTVHENRDLLIAALNKNQVTFAQIAKSAESISNGSLKLKLDSGGKVFVFEYLNKQVVLNLNQLKLNGLKYLNDILIDDILTTVELDDVYRILNEVQESLLNKADKEHTHELDDVYRILNEVQESLLNKADKEHTHTLNDITDIDSLDSKYATTDHTHTHLEKLQADQFTSVGGRFIVNSTINGMNVSLSPGTIIVSRPNDNTYAGATYIQGGEIWVADGASNGTTITKDHITVKPLGAQNGTTIYSDNITVDGKAVSLEDHTHTINDITDIDSLDNKFATIDHTHEGLEKLQT